MVVTPRLRYSVQIRYGDPIDPALDERRPGPADHRQR
jgi:hypothetical protein